MGGNSAQDTQKDITKQQLGIEQQYLGMAQQNLQQEQALAAPQIAYNTSLVSAAQKGDYSGLISAAGPAMGTIASTNKQAQEAVYDNIPAGPGRDYALAASKRGEATDVSTTLNQLFQNALQGNTNIGMQKAGIGLQESGAGLNAGSLASSSNAAIMLAQEAGKSSSMGAFGSLLGAAGQAAGGALGEGGALTGAGKAAADIGTAAII